MLARQQEPDYSAETPTNHLKVVGEQLRGTVKTTRVRRRRLAFIGNALARLREEIRMEPERYAQVMDRLILLGIAVVLAVSAYIFIADPG
jgi:hypothetical protein